MARCSSRRAVVIVLLALVSTVTLVSLGLLAHYLLTGSSAHGEPLIVAGGRCGPPTCSCFGIWFWELDCGGPGMRCHAERGRPDFLCPQMSAPELAPGWTPGFFDYLYTSLTNAAAPPMGCR